MKCVILFLLSLIVILPFEINGLVYQNISSIKVFWIFYIITWIVIPLIIYFIIIKTKLLNNNELGLIPNFQNNLDEYKFAILFTVTPFLLVVSYLILCYKISPILFPDNYFAINNNYYYFLNNTPVNKLLIAFFFSITAAVVEEIFYRGVLRSIFNNKYTYIFVSSLIFSSVHWEGGIRNLFDSFVFGLICSIYFVIYPILWPIIIGHFITNFIIYGIL